MTETVVIFVCLFVCLLSRMLGIFSSLMTCQKYCASSAVQPQRAPAVCSVCVGKQQSCNGDGWSRLCWHCFDGCRPVTACICLAHQSPLSVCGNARNVRRRRRRRGLGASERGQRSNVVAINQLALCILLLRQRHAASFLDITLRVGPPPPPPLSALDAAAAPSAPRLPPLILAS